MTPDRPAGHRRGGEPVVAGREELGGDARVAGGEVARDVGRRRTLEEGQGAGGVLVGQALERREGADAELQRLEAGILSPALVELAGVLHARAAEIEDQAILEVAERIAVDADAGAAEIGPVLQVAGVGEIDVGRRIAERRPARRRSVAMGPGAAWS